MQICNLNLKDNKSEVGGGHSGISPSDSNTYPLWPARLPFFVSFQYNGKHGPMDKWFPRMLMVINIFQRSFPITNCCLPPFEVTTV